LFSETSADAEPTNVLGAIRPSEATNAMAAVPCFSFFIEGLLSIPAAACHRGLG
jgi:hypothetical protein